MGLFLADLAQAWHKVQHGQPEQRDPGNERQHQLQGEAAGEGDDRDEVHADPRQNLDDGEQHLTHGECRLHHLGRDPAGELIGKERKALPQHQAMEVPAQPQWQIDRQHLVLNHGSQRHQPDADDQHNADPPQHAAFLRLGLAAGLPGREQVHDLPEKGKQPSFVNRHAGTEQRKRQDVAASTSGAGPQKPCQANWWRRCFVGRERVESSFEHTKHCGLR